MWRFWPTFIVPEYNRATPMRTSFVVSDHVSPF